MLVLIDLGSLESSNIGLEDFEVEMEKCDDEVVIDETELEKRAGVQYPQVGMVFDNLTG